MRMVELDESVGDIAAKRNVSYRADLTFWRGRCL